MTGEPVLYLIVCAAPRATHTADLVRMLQAEHWDVCVIATPAAVEFFDTAEVAELTRHPVRSRHKRLGEPDVLPPADAMAVCPATFNTVNKLAGGIADVLALSLLTEAVGMGLPVVVAPSLNDAQAAHTAFVRSVTTLRDMGVTVLFGSGVYEPAPPGKGTRDYPWETLLAALRASRRDHQ
jgi:phosphopantothenoylcysteine synthetase/decarboxylase